LASRFDEAVFHAVRRGQGARAGILIAVSGGADSTALMLGLARVSGRLGLRLEVATLDHGLRSESEGEAQAVIAAAQRLGLPVHRRALGLSGGVAVEERAREARYAALQQLRVERRLDLIATGHTASDQAETVLMRLARGAALGGAAAIAARTATLIRPLLGLTRRQVVEFLGAVGQPWLEDPMNQDPTFLRVRIRRELLPLYETSAGPRVAEHLARFAQYAAEDDAWLEEGAQAALGRVQRDGQLDAIAVDALARPIRRRVIAAWLRGYSLPVEAHLLEDVLEAIALGRPATLPKDRLLVARCGWLCIEPSPSRNFTQGTGVVANDAL
jgi:tRNA(Ile)-lysidine synthase